MRPSTELATKGIEVEEPIDRMFFRPLGFRLARRLAPGRITADQVTAASLVIGLVAGHLMFYNDWRLGATGVVLFVLSDVLDSADGQLARMRGGGTRFGRVLDGISDSLRFVNLYLHLAARVWVAGYGWIGVALVVAAGVSHSLQAAAADFIRHLYLGAGDQGELDLPEDLGAEPAGFWERFAFRSYAGYVRRQGRMFPGAIALVRRWRAGESSPRERAAFQDAVRPLVRGAPWIAQNIRFALLALTVVPGWPMAMCWMTIAPLNALLVGGMLWLERISRRAFDSAPQGTPAYVA